MIQIGLFQNYVRIIDTDNNILIDNPKDYIMVRKKFVNSTDYSFYYKEGQGVLVKEGGDFDQVPIADISPLNSEFTAGDVASFEVWYSKNVGFKTDPGGSGSVSSTPVIFDASTTITSSTTNLTFTGNPAVASEADIWSSEYRDIGSLRHILVDVSIYQDDEVRLAFENTVIPVGSKIVGVTASHVMTNPPNYGSHSPAVYIAADNEIEINRDNASFSTDELVRLLIIVEGVGNVIEQEGLPVSNNATAQDGESLVSKGDGTAEFRRLTPTLTQIYNSTLELGTGVEARDTNNANQLYTWEDVLDNEDLQHNEANGRFIAKRKLTVQISPFIRVLNSTANDRATFYLTIQKRDNTDALISEKKFGSTYIRDDSNAYDKGSSGGSATMTLNTDEYFEIRTIRLSSQDAGDDNPADINLSTLEIETLTLE